MNGTYLLFLIYSGFTMNLVLQCALGIKGVAESKVPINILTFLKSCLIFITVVLLWLFFSRVISSVLSGIFIYVLIFPVSACFYTGFEYLIFKYILRKDIQDESIITFPTGITAAAVFISVILAGSFLEAVVLSFGFSSGIFIVNLIIREIRKRAALEAVPLFMRGKPLVLAAMGLLSLIFTSASLLIFKMIDAL